MARYARIERQPSPISSTRLGEVPAGQVASVSLGTIAAHPYPVKAWQGTSYGELGISGLPANAAFVAVPESAANTVYWPQGTITARAYPAGTRWDVPALSLPSLQIIYTCVVSGIPPEVLPPGEEALPPITVPMESFVAQLGSEGAGSTYISAVIPDVSWAEALMSRMVGEVVINKGYRFRDGSVMLAPLAKGYLDSVVLQSGGRSGALTLTARRSTMPEIDPSWYNTKQLTGVSYQSTQATGKRLWRSEVTDQVIPGTEVVDHRGASMRVGSISLAVNSETAVMECSEA